MRKLRSVLTIFIIFGFVLVTRPGIALASQDQGLAQLYRNELGIMDLMVQNYGGSDWNAVKKFIRENPSAGPNSPVPLIALGQAYIFRYLETGNQQNLSLALENLEFAASPEAHRNWGMRWASPATVAFLATGVYRAKAAGTKDLSFATRIEALYLRLETIVTMEADARLNDYYPYRLYWSGTAADGDTKAEENSWVAYFLSLASQIFPEHPHAVFWEAKGRALASYSIVRESDQIFFNGNQIVTVEEDFTLWNHRVRGNPYYTVGTVLLMRMGALSYILTGKPVPAEFEQNVLPLYGKYRSYCTKDSSGHWVWNIPADPLGDPTLMPIPGVGDNAFERDIVAQKASDGYLWQPSGPVAKVVPNLGNYSNDGYGMAVQNGKVLWYYLTDFLWHFPPSR